MQAVIMKKIATNFSQGSYYNISILMGTLSPYPIVRTVTVAK